MDLIISAMFGAEVVLIYYLYRMWKKQRVLEVAVALLILERQKDGKSVRNNSILHGWKVPKRKEPVHKGGDESRDLASAKEES